MISVPEDIAAVFSIFHDGWIGLVSCEHSQLNIKVEIQYLAERINPVFNTFTLKLTDVSDLKFLTWPNDPSAIPRTLVEANDIFTNELEILGGEVEENQIKVTCNQPSAQYDYCGGELHFMAKSAEVLDESGKSWCIEELSALSRDYWDDWSKKNGQ